MRFRTAIALTITIVLGAALAATLGVVSALLDRAARSALDAELARGRGVLEDLLRYRRSLHRAESRVLADEPRLKAVVSTDEVTRETILGVVSDLRRALRCELLLVTDRGGRLVTDAAHPDDSGAVLRSNPLIAATLQQGEAEGVWIDGAQVFQVHGRRLSYGAMAVGAVVVGYRIDDALAHAVSGQIGAGVIIELDRQVIASSSFEDRGPPDRAALAGVLPPPGGAALREVALRGTRYLMTVAPLPGYDGEQSLHYAIFRSLDHALAPARRLVRILYGITVSALLLALLSAVWLARRLSRPVDELVDFTQRIAGGDTRPIAEVGLAETRVLGRAMNQMVAELAASRLELRDKTRLAKELEIAQRIQTSILPPNFTVPGLSLSAQMVPASEVGGDYYDVLPLVDGCWLGIGDVAGHGLSAGMVMLMVQSAFGALVRARPDAAPHELLILLNQLLFENVRNRLGADEHVTFTALRYFSDGRLLFSGAHEPLIICRAESERCELHPSPGTWLGVIEDIRHVRSDGSTRLAKGDVVILYSDGVTEAMSERREQLGIERLCAEISRCARQTPAAIHARLMDLIRGWSKAPEDDFTLLVFRHEGEHGK